jgi:hypothetical protein
MHIVLICMGYWVFMTILTSLVTWMTGGDWGWSGWRGVIVFLGGMVTLMCWARMCIYYRQKCPNSRFWYWNNYIRSLLAREEEYGKQ